MANETECIHASLPSELFKSKVKNSCIDCKWFEKYKLLKNFPKQIGWCKRFRLDPDSGYINKFELPPCACWDFEKEVKE